MTLPPDTEHAIGEVLGACVDRIRLRLSWVGGGVHGSGSEGGRVSPYASLGWRGSDEEEIVIEAAA